MSNNIVRFLFFFLINAVIAASISKSHTLQPIGRVTNRGRQTSPLVGGFRSVLVSTLPTQVDSFVRRSRPELRNAKVIRLQSQVAAGTNWKITYQVRSNRFEATVFQQPLTHTIRVSNFHKL